MRTIVVTTSIHIPTFLQEYVNNQRYNDNKDVKYIVVGDLKTPSIARDFCASLPNVMYMGVKEQEDYLRKYPLLRKHLPWNDISRRNIGHLWAYEEEGADVLLMLDDDNLSTGEDFIRRHQVVSYDHRIPIKSSTGWCNPCVILQEENDIPFYPRGYAPKHRWEKVELTVCSRKAAVAVNAGLWTGDPDVDAVTRLERPLKTLGYNWWGMEDITLAPGTWCPWNCQNTAIARRVIPAYFLSPHCGRHLDIWASYVVNRIAEHLYEGVSFGHPLANHVRTPHNLYRDLEAETPWIERTDFFCDELRRMVLIGINYQQCFEEITKQIQCPLNYKEGMEVWGECFSRLRS